MSLYEPPTWCTHLAMHTPRVARHSAYSSRCRRVAADWWRRWDLRTHWKVLAQPSQDGRAESLASHDPPLIKWWLEEGCCPRPTRRPMERSLVIIHSRTQCSKMYFMDLTNQRSLPDWVCQSMANRGMCDGAKRPLRNQAAVYICYHLLKIRALGKQVLNGRKLHVGANLLDHCRPGRPWGCHCQASCGACTTTTHAWWQPEPRLI